MTAWNPTLPASPALDELVERVERDDNVHGVLLTGSFAHGKGVPDQDDVDLYVFLDRPDETWRSFEDGQLDVKVRPVSWLSKTPPDPSNWWDRYRIARGSLMVDRSSGVIPGHLDTWATLTPHERLDAVDYYLEPYLTYSLRSLVAHESGDLDAARMDAAEALPWALRLVFALQCRVRPLNRYLAWELEAFPLTQPNMPGERLLALASQFLDRGAPEAQRALFSFLEPQLRSAGFGGAMDTYPRGITRLRP